MLEWQPPRMYAFNPVRTNVTSLEAVEYLSNEVNRVDHLVEEVRETAFADPRGLGFAKHALCIFHPRVLYSEWLLSARKLVTV